MLHDMRLSPLATTTVAIAGAARYLRGLRQCLTIVYHTTSDPLPILVSMH